MRNLLLVCGCLLAACGGDSGGPGTGPVDPADAADGCRRNCEHRIACGSMQVLEECTQSCVDDTGSFRADAFEAIIDCTTALACGVSDDSCLTECVPTAAHERYEAQCRATFTPCGTAEEVDRLCETTPAPASGDAGILCVIIPAIMDELTACMAPGTACGAALDCIDGVVTAHGIDL